MIILFYIVYQILYNYIKPFLNIPMDKKIMMIFQILTNITLNINHSESS